MSCKNCLTLSKVEIEYWRMFVCLHGCCSWLNGHQRMRSWFAQYRRVHRPLWRRWYTAIYPLIQQSSTQTEALQRAYRLQR